MCIFIKQINFLPCMGILVTQSDDLAQQHGLKGLSADLSNSKVRVTHRANDTYSVFLAAATRAALCFSKRVVCGGVGGVSGRVTDMGGRRLGGRALPGSWGGRYRALKMSQTWQQAEEGCHFSVRGSAKRRGSYASWWMVLWM